MPSAAASTARKPRRHSGDRRTLSDTLRALPWLAPVLLLIVGVVAFPAGVMIYNSTRKISKSGIDKGNVGFDNFAKIFAMPDLPRVLINTVIWVVVVVACTIVISLLLAELLNRAFPGRQLVRLAVVIPWAASVVMTTTVFYYALEPRLGILNKWLYQLGITESNQVGYTKTATSAFIVAIIIAVFVSLPFTTYTILAGLQGVPKDVLEAAQIDGAGPWRTYFSVVLPQLRPAIATSTVINIINVFNSLPILRTITGPVPGNAADTTTTLIFKIIQNDRHIDWASALSVINFVIVIVVIAIYIAIVNPMKEVD
ncbi:carbohydrate ABC transporter permease [Corynebacterium choanae]|uniref:sn-glycerol-3-phosphate transport system permease protein UgpA n=1 Tax=Corynebacterium choanae TaxID=1862358 RepID=A0A3G6J6W9_9CORY|nr:sugar ABC transporter permease [Corynebacterium choanae]AZA13855.1 sn-glycerol-3-phosphate transport system permease protein UgpA [Corynebacterium choanae]